MSKQTHNKKQFKTPHEKKAAAKAQKPKPKANGAPRKGKLGSLLGHSVISVVRAMGKAGWEFDAAKAALDKARIPAATHTIRMALLRGRKGQKKIAPLSKKELEQLEAGK